MKWFIRGFMVIGFSTMLLGMGSMDSESIIVPLCMTFLGIGMMAFSGYVDSWYAWSEGRRRNGKSNRTYGRERKW